MCPPPRPTMPKRRPKAPQGVPRRLQVSMGHKIQSVRDANIKPHSHLTESVWGGLVLDICLGLIFGERGLIFSVPGWVGGPGGAGSEDMGPALPFRKIM